MWAEIVAQSCTFFFTLVQNTTANDVKKLQNNTDNNDQLGLESDVCFRGTDANWWGGEGQTVPWPKNCHS